MSDTSGNQADHDWDRDSATTLGDLGLEDEQLGPYYKLAAEMRKLVIMSMYGPELEKFEVPVDVYIFACLDQMLSKGRERKGNKAFLDNQRELRERASSAGDFPTVSVATDQTSPGMSNRGKNEKNEKEQPCRNPGSNGLDIGVERMCYSCPYRKKNALRYNVRDHAQCALQAYISLPLLKRHITTYHSARSSQSCPRCKLYFKTEEDRNQHVDRMPKCAITADDTEVCNDEDGITRENIQRLTGRRVRTRVDTWQKIWNTLFPREAMCPSPDFEPPVELEEVEQIFFDRDNTRKFYESLAGTNSQALFYETQVYIGDTLKLCHSLYHHENSGKRHEQMNIFLNRVRSVVVQALPRTDLLDHSRPVVPFQQWPWPGLHSYNAASSTSDQSSLIGTAIGSSEAGYGQLSHSSTSRTHNSLGGQDSHADLSIMGPYAKLSSGFSFRIPVRRNPFISAISDAESVTDQETGSSSLRGERKPESYEPVSRLEGTSIPNPEPFQMTKTPVRLEGTQEATETKLEPGGDSHRIVQIDPWPAITESTYPADIEKSCGPESTGATKPFITSSSMARDLSPSSNTVPTFGVRFCDLPDDFQDEVELTTRGQEPSCWTCTPSASLLQDHIPLAIDEHPVVIPVKNQYPLMGIFSPPPDPHPLFISPVAQIPEADIHHVFSAFPACLGFYLLINGMLQVIMPDDFDVEENLAVLPSRFGGLTVSLIRESICPTTREVPPSPPTVVSSTTISRIQERMFGQKVLPGSSSVASVRTDLSSGLTPAKSFGFTVGCAVRAKVPGSETKQRFEGKTGVVVAAIDDISRQYVTVPTHLLTDAVNASKKSGSETHMWHKAVKVLVASNSMELGEVVRVFDQEPRSFPVGFSHDVSLVDISNLPAVPRENPLAADLEWLSQAEWFNIKYNSNNLLLLDDQCREAKSIGVVDSRCQVVGQGIFKVHQESRKPTSLLSRLSSGSGSSRAQDPRDDLSTWTRLVARSILYRVRPDLPSRGSESGVPICFLEGQGASEKVKVAGFASFVQMASDVQKYDLEGDKLYKRLQEGRVAFYGAFQVPEELRDGYRISTS